MEGGKVYKEDPNFISYVFNFDDENKTNMLNMLQYVALALIPIVIILKLIKNYVPEEDDTKGSAEILVEVLGQLIVIFLEIWFVDKMIRFFPTYSGVAYHKLNELCFVIPFLILLVTMQTKLGAKINILFDRVMELWSPSQPQPSKKNNNVRVMQPLAGGGGGGHQNSQADHLDQQMIRPPPQYTGVKTTMINDLPIQDQYNNVRNDILDPSPLMAANEALCGSFGGSAW